MKNLEINFTAKIVKEPFFSAFQEFKRCVLRVLLVKSKRCTLRILRLKLKLRVLRVKLKLRGLGVLRVRTPQKRVC